MTELNISHETLTRDNGTNLTCGTKIAMCHNTDVTRGQLFFLLNKKLKKIKLKYHEVTRDINY